MKNILFLISAIFLFSFISFSLVSAGPDKPTATNVTIVAPTTNAYLTGAYTIVCNISQGYELQNWTNATFYATSTALTGNTTEAKLGMSANGTDGANSSRSFVKNIDSTIIEDGEDYTFKCQITNGTDWVNKTVAVKVDNTVPTAPNSPSPVSNIVNTTSGTQTFSTTVVNRETTACTYWIQERGSASPTTGTGTYSASTCSFDYSFNSTTYGDFDWATIASDGKDSTQSTVFTFQSRVQDPNHGVSSGGYTPLVSGTTPEVATVSFSQGIKNFINSIINFIKSLFS